mmetsp:Transcript_56524/g.132559  ORF Transcript_56524/g.132559 Transcript_56524/m.132559 type:complete len:262 (+) Transcript_56524:84-869(+)
MKGDSILRSNTKDSLASSSDFPSSVESLCDYTASLDQIEDLYRQSQQHVWSLSLEREPGQKLGMLVAPALDDTALVVTHISENGQIWTWNEQHPKEHLRCCDLLLEVGGVSGDAERMTTALKTAGSVLSVRVMRLVKFTANISMCAWFGGLGLAVDDRNVVISIQSGSPCAEYKKLVPAELCIRPGDRVLAVNEPEEKSWRQLFSTSRSVELIVQRPMQGEAPWRVGSPRQAAQPPPAPLPHLMRSNSRLQEHLNVRVPCH